MAEEEVERLTRECAAFSTKAAELFAATKKLMSANEVKRLHKIPKLIHQTAHKKPWNRCWQICHATWKRDYPSPEYTHTMWTDEDLSELVKRHYPEFLATYLNAPRKIQRIDLARYLLLHKHGGIYADMDYESCRNMYLCLSQSKINVVESPYVKNERFHNSLLASDAKRDFWYATAREASRRLAGSDRGDVLWTTGPKLMDEMCRRRAKHVHPLASSLFQPPLGRVFAEHRLTGVWWRTKKKPAVRPRLERAARELGELDVAEPPLSTEAIEVSVDEPDGVQIDLV